MTCFFRALAGEPTDRVPVWLLFPYHPTAYYVDVRNHKDYRRVFDFSLEQGVVMLNRRNLTVPMHSAAVACEHEKISTPQGRVHRRQWRYNDELLYSDHPHDPGTVGRKLLSSAEDLEIFCHLPLEETEAVLTKALDSQLGRYRKEQAEFPLECGAMMLDLGSPVDVLYHSAVLEEYSIWSLTHDEMIQEWLERRMRQLEVVYRYCLDRELADVYFLVGSELAAPPLVSCDTFRKWVVAYEGRLIALIHSYGKKAIQHFHGQIRDLLPDFLAMCPDGLHTIEAPPVGNCTLRQAFDATQNSITLIGNIQYDEFRSSTPAFMRQRVRETLDEADGCRFIFSPTAGPFDPAPSQNLIANYLAFIDACRQP